MALVAGARLGPYEIVGPLGTGGMGEVYRARDSRLKRDVAVKVLPAELSAAPAALARLEHEARAVAALSHPNILAIHDIGNQDGIAFVVMELLEGSTLREHLRTGPLPMPQAFDIALQIAKALAAAHDQGIVHRDVKPENVFVSRDGHVKLLDFGLAKWLPAVTFDGASEQSTRSVATVPGVVLGTVGYMAPEQLRGQSVDARADVFSFGAVLYEMLVGARAFQGATAMDTIAAILSQDLPPMRPGTEEVAPSLTAVVRRCLEKSADRRFASARELVRALQANVREDASSSTAPRRRARSRVVMGTAVVVVLAGLAAVRFGPDRPAAGVPAHGRAIAMLDFENLTGDSELDWIGQGLPELLATALARSPDLDVYDPQRLKVLLEGPPATRDVGAALYGRLHEGGIGRAIVGSILRSSDHLVIQCRVTDVESGRVIRSAAIEGTASDGLFVLAGALVQELQTALEVELAGANVADRFLREITTSSADAYKLFLRGRTAFIASRWREAAGYYEQALSLDGDFVSARADLTACYWNLGDQARTRTSLEAAKRLRDRASTRDALQIELIDAVVSSDSERLVRVASTLGELYPENRFFVYLLGRGYFMAERYERCIATLAPLVRERWTWGWTYVLSAQSYQALGRMDEARRHFAIGMEVTHGNPELAVAYAQFLGKHGDAGAARAVLMEASHSPDLGEALATGVEIHLELASLDESAGQVEGAREWFSRALAQAPADSKAARVAAEGLRRLEGRR